MSCLRTFRHLGIMVCRPTWASVRLGDTLAMLISRETINGIVVVLAVILINDTYVANLYQWSSIFFAKMYN